MSIFAGLLFNQGHIHDPDLARALAGGTSRDDIAPPDASAPAADPARPCPPPLRLGRVVRGRGWVALQEPPRVGCR